MSWLESIIEFVSPEWAAKRGLWKAQFQAWAASGFRSAEPSRLGSTRAISATPDYHFEQGYDREHMVNRAMQLERDNSIARGLLERNTENVVSSGIIPQARTEDEDWNQQAEELFFEWAESSADVRGMSSFWELQRLAQYGMTRDGDVGCILRDDGSIQLIESMRIAAPIGKEYSPYHIDGIDLDRSGKPLNYHIVPLRGDESYTPNTRDYSQRVIIPAESFIFMARRTSPSQTRGEPAMAQAMEQFEHLDKLMEAVVVSARMAACFGFLIKSPMPPGPMNSTATSSAGRSLDNMEIEPGMYKYLRPGEDVSMLSPAQPSQQLDQFVVLLARILGLPLGMPLELLMLDFTRTNYSSARASLLQAYRSFKRQQEMLIGTFCRRIWRWKIQGWIKDGLLPQNDQWMRHQWIPPGWAWVDPVKEIQAAQMEVDAGFRTKADVIASQGRDYQEVRRARQREYEAEREAGLPETRSTLTRDPMAQIIAANRGEEIQ